MEGKHSLGKGLITSWGEAGLIHLVWTRLEGIHSRDKAERIPSFGKAGLIHSVTRLR